MYLEPEEIEGLILETPFISQLEPGWYEFQVSIQFTKDGKEYISDSNTTFDVIVPEIAQPHLYRIDEKINDVFPSIFLVNFQSGELNNTLPNNPLPIPGGKLIFRSLMTLDDAYFIWDFDTGEIKHVGNYAWPIWQDAVSAPNVSPDGWRTAIEIHDREPYEKENFDIGIIDLWNESKVNLNNTATIREIDPSWSPSGEKIAYIAYAINDTNELQTGESDLYVYDSETFTHRRVTYSPNFIKSSVTWVDEDTLAVILPESINIKPQNDLYNQQTGIGIVDLSTGQMEVINTHPFSENATIEYFTKTNVFSIKDGGSINSSDKHFIYSTNGQKIEEFSELSYYQTCHFLDAKPFQFLCWDSYGKKIGLFQPGKEESIKTLSYGGDQDQGIPKVLGRVVPEGFIILDPENNRIEQYGEDGTQIGVFDVPNLSQVFAWPAGEILYIPNE